MKLAEQWLRFAVENGSVKAKAELGVMLMHNPSLDAEGSREVAALLAEAAEAGSSNASFALGKMILGGKPSAEALAALRDYSEKAFDGGRADGAFLMALSYAMGQNPDLDQAVQWLEMGKVDKDWRSRYALQMIQQGADVVDAFKAVVHARFEDWVEAYDAGRPAPPNVTPPKIIKMTKPRSPSGFVALNVEGNVTVEFVVSPNGRPQGIQVIKSSHEELNTAAIKTVEAWKFTPAMKDGQYAPIKIKVPLRFRTGS